MNDDQLTKLKTFIASTVKIEVGTLRTEMTGQFEEQNEILNEIQDAIGERFDTHQAALRHQAAGLDDHEGRITRLEKRAA